MPEVEPPAGEGALEAPASDPGTGLPIVPHLGRTLACVDIGSNSVHLLVASVLDGRLETPLDDRSVFLGLGEAAEGGRFGPEVRSSLVGALLDDAAIATTLGAEAIVFVGTEPFRRAADAARVVRDIERAGWPLHVLGHAEEALLTLIGATGGRPADSGIAVVDVGGGSSEVALAGPGRAPTAVGVLAGSARLTRALVRSDPTAAAEIDAVRTAAARLFRAVPPSDVGGVVAVGGTASNIVKVLAMAGGTEPDAWLTRERLEQAIAILAGAPAARTAERFLLNPIRAQVLPAGAAILEAVLDRFGVPGLTATDMGIREGTILAVARAGPSWRDALRSLARGWPD